MNWRELVSLAQDEILQIHKLLDDTDFDELDLEAGALKPEVQGKGRGFSLGSQAASCFRAWLP
jgi:hypothetical protein